MNLSPSPSPPRGGEPENPTSDSPFSQRQGGQGGGYAEYPHDPLWDALREVSDPEMGISLVDMGLVVEANLVDSVAHIQLTYTAMGCPATEMIEDDVRARLLQVPEVNAVEIETVWEPVWTKARLTAEGRDGLLLNGLAL